MAKEEQDHQTKYDKGDAGKYDAANGRRRDHRYVYHTAHTLKDIDGVSRRI